MRPPVIGQEDQPFTLATLPPGRAQKRLALAIVLAFLAALFISAWEPSNVQWRRVDAFIPAYGTAMFVNDMITATLLFNQFAILRSRALLTISIGYPPLRRLAKLRDNFSDVGHLPPPKIDGLALNCYGLLSMDHRLVAKTVGLHMIEQEIADTSMGID